MKKLILLSLVTLLCMPLTVYAASIGGVETQGAGKFTLGLDQEFVFDRDTKDVSVSEIVETTIAATGKLKSEVDKMYRTMLKISYGLFDNLDVYVKLGMADFEAKGKKSGIWENSATGDTGIWEASTKLRGDNAFAYGFGVKGTYPLEDDWIIGCDVLYLRHKNDFKATGTLSVYDDTGTPIPIDDPSESWKGDMTFQAWHVAPYIAKEIENFVPYFGVKYSDQRIEYKSEDSKIKFKANDNFGVFLGTDYKIAENWTLNLEGRFIDETAMSFATTYKF
ncbi:MAG: outer membrane beta-barrel protein [Candidatus Omnitrophica bacterium]|nr:outer membrane beta-barrel protein [Candidatus Omnitrophota bacterium]